MRKCGSITLIIFAVLTSQVLTFCKDKGGDMSLGDRKILMIIAPDQFRDEELFEPKKAFEEKGAKVVVASTTTEKVDGMQGGSFEPALLLNDVKVDDYDAVIFVGGVGAKKLFDDAKAQEIAKRAFEKKKVLAAICLASAILANAGVLKGKKATGFNITKEYVHKGGGVFTNEPVTVDGLIITANGPGAAKDFAEEIIKLLR
jgi:protease I